MSAVPPAHVPRAPQAAPSRETVQRDLLLALGITAQAHGRGQSLDAALDARNASAVLRVLATAMQRAPQSPAQTNVPEWAGSLVGEAVLAFLDTMAGQGAVAPTLPWLRFTFGQGRGKLTLPMRAVAGAGFAMDWHEEGAAIPVSALRLVSAGALTPKTGALLTTFTQELLDATDDALLQIIRTSVAADTGKALDQLLFSATSGTTISPPGLGTFATGALTAASTGSNAASISADLRGRVDAVVAAGFGSARMRWVMSTHNAGALAQYFTEVQVRNSLANIPIASGPWVDDATVFLVDGAGVAYASDLPIVEVSASATIHEVDADAAEDLMTGAPVRGLWQARSQSLRSVAMADWLAVPGSVATLTGCDW